jgi:hypothetical protein
MFTNVSASPPPAHRRVFRTPLRVESLGDHERPRFLGYAANLSPTGAFVQSTRPRPPGTRLELRLHLPDPVQAPVSCVGEVVWARGYEGVLGPGPGMGIRFLEVAPSAIEALERICQKS